MNSFMSLLPSSRLLRITLLAGVGITGIALVYRYVRRKHTIIVEDITESSPPCDPGSAIKQKLKLLLGRDNVHCADVDRVEELIDSLIMGGDAELQVIADFDRTLTPLTHNGLPVPSCHCVVSSCENLPDWFGEETEKSRAYYQAIEFNPAMTSEEKFPFMEEWWHKAQERLVRCSITKAEIVKAVSDSNLYLRDKGEEILELLHFNEIPLLVFSAGVGDVIEQAFVQRYKLYSNIHIIANWMEFSHEGILVDFKGVPIHTFNKNVHALRNASYFGSLGKRHNVILLGDSLGDLTIADGLPRYENLLTIGYLNEHVEESLAEYTEKFDIVLTKESGMDLLLSLLENILPCGNA